MPEQNNSNIPPVRYRKKKKEIAAPVLTKEVNPAPVSEPVKVKPTSNRIKKSEDKALAVSEPIPSKKANKKVSEKTSESITAKPPRKKRETTKPSSTPEILKDEVKTGSKLKAKVSEIVEIAKKIIKPIKPAKSPKAIPEKKNIVQEIAPAQIQPAIEQAKEIIEDIKADTQIPKKRDNKRNKSGKIAQNDSEINVATVIPKAVVTSQPSESSSQIADEGTPTQSAKARRRSRWRKKKALKAKELRNSVLNHEQTEQSDEKIDTDDSSPVIKGLVLKKAQDPQMKTIDAQKQAEALEPEKQVQKKVHPNKHKAKNAPEQAEAQEPVKQAQKKVHPNQHKAKTVPETPESQEPVKQMHKKVHPNQHKAKTVPEQVEAQEPVKQVQKKAHPNQHKAKTVPEQVESQEPVKQVQKKVHPNQHKAKTAPEQVESQEPVKQVQKKAHPNQHKAKTAPEQVEAKDPVKQVQKKAHPKKDELKKQAQADAQKKEELKKKPKKIYLINKSSILSEKESIDPFYINFFNKLESNLNGNLYIESGTSLLLAVSGGVDSVVMMDVFANLSIKQNLSIVVSHYNHQLRGKQSDDDLEFVKDLASNYNIQFYAGGADVMKYAEENSLSIEHAARVLRYRYLVQTAQNSGSEFVLTAHTQDDSTETFFFNLLRGSGLTGLTGIPEKRRVSKNVSLLRPLLNFSKKELIEYAEKRNLKWREDESNGMMYYTRNKIRSKLLPLIKSEFSKNLDDVILRTSKLLKGADSFIEKYVENILEGILIDKKPERFSLKISLLNTLSDFLAGEVIQKALNIYLKIPSVSMSAIDRIIALSSSPTGSMADVTKNIFVLKDRDHLIFSKRNLTEHLAMHIEKTGEFQIPGGYLSLEEVQKKKVKYTENPDIEYFDYDLLPARLTIRNWSAGDSFQPLGMEGSVKISDFLTNRKVALIDKSKTFLLAVNKEIIWIVGMRMDDRFKVTSSTSRFLRAEFKRF